MCARARSSLHMRGTHVCLVCSACLISVFGKFIRRQAVPEGIESTGVLPAHGVVWVFALPCPARRHLALQRDEGVGLPSDPKRPVPHLTPMHPSYTLNLCSDPLGGTHVPGRQAGVGLEVCPWVSSPARIGSPSHTQRHLLRPPPPRAALRTAHQLIKQRAHNQL